MNVPGPRILIVDDEPNILLTVEAILRQEGYQIRAVSSGAAAIDAIHQYHFDLVLTDLKMPGIGGLQVLQEVRNCSPDTVTVMMTGYGSMDSALEALQLGAYEYLLKPTGVTALKAAVRRSLERKRLSEIDTLYRITRTLARARGAQEIQSEVEEAVRRVLNAANACLVAFDREPSPIECAESLRPLLNHPRVLPRLASGAMVGVDDLADAAEAKPPNKLSFIIVPALANDRLVCALVVDNGCEPFDFHAAAIRFLQGVAIQTALALENASLIEELRKNNRELAAANEKLRELDKLKSQFLSVATHELRTPLTVILGYNSMLADTLEDRLSPEERENLKESVGACNRLIRLVNSMLDLTQIEAGAMKMSRRNTDLRTIAKNVVTLFQAEARRNHLSVHLEMPAQIPPLLIDPERIEQVLVNLIGNAFKFTCAGSITVSVRLLPQNRAVEVAVADTGVGIAAGEQARIFDEFTQAGPPNAGSGQQGSGLGLAIARRIVEAHEGRIEVESQPGRGSTFRFYLPMTAQHSPSGVISA